MQTTLMHSVIGQLQQERKRLEHELHRITSALAAFGKAYGHNGTRSGRKHTISAAGRKRIAAAQRARWAKVRAGKKA